MKREITAAVCCFKTLMMPRAQPHLEKTNLFFEKLGVVLMEKFTGHWFPENPSRGQAYRYRSQIAMWRFLVFCCCFFFEIIMLQYEYSGVICRCIRINEFQQQDPEVLRACEDSRMEMHELELPVNLTVWVDPGEVSYRLHYYSGWFLSKWRVKIHLYVSALGTKLSVWKYLVLFMFRIGENNPPCSFAIFSHPDEETLNAPFDLDSNGIVRQQVWLRLQTGRLIRSGLTCSLSFLLQALNPEASPWVPGESIPEGARLPQPDCSATSSNSDEQDFFSSCTSSTCSSLSPRPNSDYWGYDYHGNNYDNDYCNRY